MILTGKQAACFVGMKDERVQVQPAGVDLTLKEVHAFQTEGEIDFDNSSRKISRTKKIEFKDGKVRLRQGCYKIIYNEYVRIPLEYAGLGFPRSSLLRCGVDVACALWDPGYHGRSESLLLVHNPKGIVLHKDARVAQLVFVKMSKKASFGYTGRYLGENR
ncbi:MAG: deoxyuridine 5'-triphosphate nucleotidohydrolase [Candidatus Anstonellaceae archaeon]